MNTWLGTYSNSFWYDDNWTDGIPTNDDVLVFNGSANNDCQAFGPSIDPNWDPMSGLPADDSFNKIVIDGYEGKIELNGDVVIHELQMASGTINPVGYDQDISIVDTFTWTGGTLNDTNYANSLAMELGSTMLVAPGVGNSVTTGSFFNLIDGTSTNAGATATFTEGTVNFRNDAGIHLGYFCQAKIDTSNGTVLFSGRNPVMGNVYTIRGKAEVYKREGFPAAWLCEKMGIIVAGGELIIYPTAIADVTGQIYNLTENPSVQLNSGNIVLYDDSTLEVLHGLKATGGAVVTRYKGDAPNQAEIVRGTSTIIGDFYNAGAQVVMYHNLPSRRPGWGNPNVPNAGPFIFSQLVVTEDVYWSAGTYRPAVNIQSQDEDYADKWVCGGTFHIMSNPTIAPTAVVVDGGAIADNEIFLGNVNGPWLIIESLRGNIDLSYGVCHPYPVISGASWCAIEPLTPGSKKLRLQKI